MKKVFKKVVSLTLALVLVACGITYTKDVEAATGIDDWKANAITVPAEGKLVGAGYIDVEFDNSMEGYTYTVYLDGKPMYWIGDDIVRTDIGEQVTNEAKTKSFTSEVEGKTEVYTTTVSKHELTVKASDGENEYVSEPRTFYVSKKGMALGGDMSDKVSLKKLNCSWYYNWATEAFNNSIDEDVAHIPMMWGNGDDVKESMENLDTTANYILGFNEPDIESQANMFFFDGIDTWKEYISPLNMRKVSPAPASPGGDSGWLNQFMNGDYKCKNPFDETQWAEYSKYSGSKVAEATKTWVDGIGEDVDAVVLHYYRTQINLDGLLEAVNTLWEIYHKPIWVTELSIFGAKGGSNDYSYELPEKRAAMAEFVKGIVENLDDIPYVERYCWFAYDIDSTNDIDAFDGSGATAMFEYASGAYTELGRLYSSIGNPEGYVGETISDDEMFVYVPPETSVPETTAEPTTVAPTEKTTDVSIKQTTTQEQKTTTKKLGRTTVKSASKKKVSKKVKITFKKVTGAKKYQVQISKTKKFKKILVKKTVKKVDVTISSKKIKNIKKLYVRVKAVGAEKWSKVKRIKIKK